MKTIIRAIALAGALSLTAGAAGADRAGQYDERVKALMGRGEIVAAFRHVDASRDAILREWIAITEINAPSKMEKERAAYVEKLLRGYRLQDIRYDSAGNLIAVRKGTGGGPNVVVDAHLDTVFQKGLAIKATVKDGRIHAPGVGDDTRNIEAILATIRALDHANVRTKGDLIFVFTVEEEIGLGGVGKFLADNKGTIDYYIALDGGYEGFTYGGLGSRWYRHHFVGPGGHTKTSTPPYSAALPLARAIARIYELEVPAEPLTYLNIGMLSGSEVPNAKAPDAWFTVDLRSTDNAVIAGLEGKIAAILGEEADRVGMTFKTEVLSSLPAAQLPGHRESYLVRMTESVHAALGFERPPITITASNNSNAALLEGIPAISTGAAPCSGEHSLAESCAIEPIYRGIKKILLLEVALAQLGSG